MVENKAYIHGYVCGYMAAVRDAYGGDDSALEPEIVAAFWSAAARLHAQNPVDFDSELTAIFGCLPVISNQDF